MFSAKANKVPSAWKSQQYQEQETLRKSDNASTGPGSPPCTTSRRQGSRSSDPTSMTCQARALSGLACSTRDGQGTFRPSVEIPKTMGRFPPRHFDALTQFNSTRNVWIRQLIDVDAKFSLTLLSQNLYHWLL